MPPRPRSLMAALAALAMAAPLAVAAAGPSTGAVSVSWARRAGGLVQPTHVTSAPDGTSRMFVAEKRGTVRVFREGRLLSRPFLDIRNRVRTGGEAGLLSIAFSPGYRGEPHVFVAYTTTGNDLRVTRFTAPSPTADRVRTSTGRPVITVRHPDRYSNHFAGQLAFGPSGLLFVSTGDGGGSGDPAARSQDPRSLQGKILRLQVLGADAACGRPYCVPPDNPYAGPVSGRGEVWSVGLRNAWRFSVDHVTGDLWVGDVGQGAYEEVDRIPAGAGGRNLGWSCKEGFATYNASRCDPGAAYHDPVAVYGRGYGTSITGGFVYRGARYASLLGGKYVGGDFGSGRVFYLDGSRRRGAGRLPGVTSFGEGRDKELWAVTISGGLYEMRAS